MSLRPTPETDAVATFRPNDTGFDDWTPAEVARKLERERDEARRELNEIRAERDLARLSSLESDQMHDRMVGELEKVYKELDKAREDLARITEAARAVVDRWEQPSWKDTEPTAAVIYRLRDALGREAE